MPNLPQTTDSELLAAIPRMQPWTEATKPGRWILREPGKQFLIYAADGTELDLTGVTGTFHIRNVNLQTGKLLTRPETIQAGGKVTLPNGIIWLTK